MLRILILFTVLAISVCLGIQLTHYSGYVLITFNHWTIEITLWLGLLILVLLFFLFHTVLVILNMLRKAPTAFRRWENQHRTQKAHAKTQQGLIEFSEGYWSDAKNHLMKALPDTDTPLLNYLTAARAAQEMGDSKLRDDYLRDAQQSMPQAKIAVELTQAQLQLANHQWEQALATLRHLQDLVPQHPYVLKLLMHLYQEIKDWNQLIILLPILRKNHILSANAFEILQQQTYLEALTDLAKQNKATAVETFMSNLPKHLAQNAEITAHYAQFLMNQGEQAKAENLLQTALRKEYNERLIDLYGQLHINEKQLIFAESLLKKYAYSSALYLCLGRLCLANQLWGKAKGYLEKSISLDPNSNAYWELGQLLEQLNQTTEACSAYREGLAYVIKRSHG